MEDKIIMSAKEVNRIRVLQKIMDRQVSQVDGARIMGISDRQVRRMIKKIRGNGIASIVHQSRGKPSPKKMDKELREKTLCLYEEKYPDFGPTFAHEKLRDHHGIQISRETLRQWLILDNLWQVRKRKKRDLHLWRERKAYEGEMIQIDGSHHRWLEDRLDQEICLMGYIDDATGTVFGRFYEYEGVFPALDSFEEFVKRNGIPESIYIDRHSTYKTTRKASVDEDLEGLESNTQFQQVMKSIGVKVIFARSPQAKGRVERLFETLQDRLVKEMRLEGVSSIQEANTFLENYLPTFNKKFSVTAKEKVKLYKKVSDEFDYKWTFSLRIKRTIGKDFTIQCFNRLFIVKNPYLALKGQKVLVKQALDGDLQFETKTKILSVKEITQKDLELVKKAQKALKKQLKKRSAFRKSKKSWMDKFYFGKRRVQLVK